MKFLVVLALTLAMGSAAFIGERAKRESIVIPPNVLAFLQEFLARPAVQEAIASSEFYQCLDSQLAAAGHGGLNIPFLKALHASGNFNPEYIKNHPIVQGCVAQQGGIVELITKSQLVRRLKAWIVAQPELADKVKTAILAVLGEDLGGRLLALIASLPDSIEARESVNIPPHVLAFLLDFLARPAVQEGIASSTFYQCLDGQLKAAGYSGLNLEFLRGLHASGNFNPEYIKNNPIVQGCVASHGGLVELITKSQLVRRLKAWIVAQPDLAGKVREAILLVLGEVDGNRLLALIASLPDSIEARESINIPPHVLSFLLEFLARPAVQEGIASSSFYQCLDGQLKAAGHSGLNLEFLRGLHASGNFNPEYIKSHPIVQGCVAAQGGVVELITKSQLVRRLKAWIVAQPDLAGKVREAILLVLGEVDGNRLLALIASIPDSIEARESINIPPHVLSFLLEFLARPAVQQGIASSKFYQCLDGQLKAAGHSGLNLEFLRALHASGNFNPDYIKNHPIVQGCVAQQGGIVELITKSELVKQLKAWIVAQPDLAVKVREAILTVLGEDLGGRLLALIASLPKY